MGDAEQTVVRVLPEIAEIEAGLWDACANPPGSDELSGESYNPFLSHVFLDALEQSESVSAEAGWAPQHLVMEDGAGRVMGCMPCYLKGHSLGEYVFDHGWADAFERAGGDYYPKLQAAVPFTPVTGRRLLVPPGPDAEHRERLLVSAALQLLERYEASSLHLTFLTEPEWARLGELGLLQRTDQQFHWTNDGYGDFDDFLASLASRKRKAIRKERREALTEGVSIDWVTGSDLNEACWDSFFGFYLDTGARKWGSPYLNREFFSRIGETMADRILLIRCQRDGREIGAALNIIGNETLYGRYWGCGEHHRFLHFEACYYQAIEFAIVHRLKRVEAGAQGQHKIARGYLPQTTYSAHFIANPSLRDAVASYLARERSYVEMESAALAEASPFRRDASCPKSNET